MEPSKETPSGRIDVASEPFSSNENVPSPLKAPIPLPVSIPLAPASAPVPLVTTSVIDAVSGPDVPTDARPLYVPLNESPASVVMVNWPETRSTVLCDRALTRSSTDPADNAPAVIALGDASIGLVSASCRAEEHALTATETTNKRNTPEFTGTLVWGMSAPQEQNAHRFAYAIADAIPADSAQS